MPSCIVKGCCNSWKKKSDIIIHTFPKNKDIIKLWLHQIPQDFGDIDDFAQKVLEGKKSDLFRICSRHFSPQSYIDGGCRKRLRKDAVPTIFEVTPSAAPRPQRRACKENKGKNVGKKVKTCIRMNNIYIRNKMDAWTMTEANIFMLNSKNGAAMQNKKVIFEKCRGCHTRSSPCKKLSCYIGGKEHNSLKDKSMEHTRKRASTKKSLRASSKLKKLKPSDSSAVSSSSGGTCAHEDHVAKNDLKTISNGQHGRTSKTKISSSGGDGNCNSTEGPTFVGVGTLEDDQSIECKKADNDTQKILAEIELLTEQNPTPVEDGLQKTLQEEGAHNTKRTKSQTRQSRSYTCVCGKSYSSSYNLHRHQKTHVGDKEISNGHLVGEACEVKVTSEKSFPCVCGKSYTISSHLYRHQKTCQAVSKSNLESDAEERRLKPYVCTCGKRYTCSSHLYRHQKSHVDGKKESAMTYICDCGKAFSNKSDLDQHQKTHTQEKCSMEEHEGDSVEDTETEATGSKKPYVCICGKSYTCSSHLYRHQRTHQDDVSGSSRYQAEQSIMEKPYKCECGKSYTSTSHLYRHQRTHQTQELLVDEMDCDSDVEIEESGQKPYQCECGKSFILWFSLMVHKRIHCKVKLQASSASGQDRS